MEKINVQEIETTTIPYALPGANKIMRKTETSLQILANKINEIIDVLSDCELKTPAKWVPEYEEEYFFISDNGNIVRTWFANIERDRFRLKNNNVFRTETEAKKELNKIMNP